MSWIKDQMSTTLISIERDKRESENKKEKENKEKTLFFLPDKESKLLVSGIDKQDTREI